MMNHGYRYEVKHNPREEAYGLGWQVMRINSVGQGWEVGAYRTPHAAEHAAAALRWAEVMDQWDSSSA